MDAAPGISSSRVGDIVVAGDDDESQSEWLLLLLISGAEMTLTRLPDDKI